MDYIMKELANLDKKKLPPDSQHQHRVQGNQKLLESCNGSSGSRAEHKSWTIPQKTDIGAIVKTNTIIVAKTEQPLHSIENRNSTTAKMDHSTCDKCKIEGKFRAQVVLSFIANVTTLWLDLAFDSSF